MAQAERSSGNTQPKEEKPNAPQSKFRGPTVRIIGAAIAVGAIAVAATAFMLRDRIYQPANSYGTDSPHIATPAEQAPAQQK